MLLVIEPRSPESGLPYPRRDVPYEERIFNYRLSLECIRKIRNIFFVKKPHKKRGRPTKFQAKTKLFTLLDSLLKNIDNR